MASPQSDSTSSSSSYKVHKLQSENEALQRTVHHLQEAARRRAEKALTTILGPASKSTPHSISTSPTREASLQERCQAAELEALRLARENLRLEEQLRDDNSNEPPIGSRSPPPNATLSKPIFADPFWPHLPSSLRDKVISRVREINRSASPIRQEKEDFFRKASGAIPSLLLNEATQRNDALSRQVIFLEGTIRELKQTNASLSHNILVRGNCSPSLSCSSDFVVSPTLDPEIHILLRRPTPLSTPMSQSGREPSTPTPVILTSPRAPEYPHSVLQMISSDDEEAKVPFLLDEVEELCAQNCSVTHGQVAHISSLSDVDMLGNILPIKEEPGTIMGRVVARSAARQSKITDFFSGGLASNGPTPDFH